MPRHKDRKQAVVLLTEEQHADLLILAGAEGVSAYMRRLVREDAQRRDLRWCENLPSANIAER